MHMLYISTIRFNVIVKFTISVATRVPFERCTANDRQLK